MTEPDTLPAGTMSAWLDGMQRALAGEAESDVPCGECTACCRSSQFVHVGPEETDTRSHIPARHLVAAPFLPTGHHVMGYDEDGRCPMLGEEGCTIYEHRPRACRTYDCRVFTAAGVEPSEDQPAIAAQVRRWRFALDGEEDRALAAAVVAAAAYLHEHPDALPDGVRAANPVQLAVVAVQVHSAFRGRSVDE